MDSLILLGCLTCLLLCSKKSRGPSQDNRLQVSSVDVSVDKFLDGPNSPSISTSEGSSNQTLGWIPGMSPLSIDKFNTLSICSRDNVECLWLNKSSCPQGLESSWIEGMSGEGLLDSWSLEAVGVVVLRQDPEKVSGNIYSLCHGVINKSFRIS